MLAVVSVAVVAVAVVAVVAVGVAQRGSKTDVCSCVMLAVV